MDNKLKWSYALAWASLAIGLAVFDPSSAHARKLIPIESGPAPGSGLEVLVRDEQGILPRAKVWVETPEGAVVAEGEANALGVYSASIPEPTLAGGVTVTGFSPGHSAVSVFENVAHRVAMTLPSVLTDRYNVLEGTLSGFPDNEDEDKGVIGLVAKTFQLDDLAQLDVSAFLSPLKDTINVFGPRQIPSNLVIPDQTFPIYIIPIRINKPTYRLPMAVNSAGRFFGVTGKIPAQEALGAIKDGDFWEVVNLLEFTGVGLGPSITAPGTRGTIARLDFNATTPISQAMPLRAGRNFSRAEAKRLAISAWQPIPGVFVPTDMKLLQEDPIALRAVDRRATRVLDVLVNTNGTRYRGTWLPQGASAAPDYALTADLSGAGLEGAWTLRGGEAARLMMAHLETKRFLSLGNGAFAFEDRWILVGPRRPVFRIPAGAQKALRPELVGRISHISVDLLQTSPRGYPFIEGENLVNELVGVEKIRKEFR